MSSILESVDVAQARTRTPWTKGPLIGPTPPLKLREIWAIEQRPRKKSFQLPAWDEFQSTVHRVIRPHLPK